MLRLLLLLSSLINTEHYGARERMTDAMSSDGKNTTTSYIPSTVRREDLVPVESLCM